MAITMVISKLRYSREREFISTGLHIGVTFMGYIFVCTFKSKENLELYVYTL